MNEIWISVFECSATWFVTIVVVNTIWNYFQGLPLREAIKPISYMALPKERNRNQLMAVLFDSHPEPVRTKLYNLEFQIRKIYKQANFVIRLEIYVVIGFYLTSLFEPFSICLWLQRFIGLVIFETTLFIVHLLYLWKAGKLDKKQEALFSPEVDN